MTDEHYAKLLSRVVTNRSICGGIPVIKGTRVGVYIILANLADGLTPKEIIEYYPTLKISDVRAAMVYAAEYAAEEARDIRDARRAIIEAKSKGVVSRDELKEELDKKNPTKKTGKKSSKKSNVKR